MEDSQDQQQAAPAAAAQQENTQQEDTQQDVVGEAMRAPAPPSTAARQQQRWPPMPQAPRSRRKPRRAKPEVVMRSVGVPGKAGGAGAAVVGVPGSVVWKCRQSACMRLAVVEVGDPAAVVATQSCMQFRPHRLAKSCRVSSCVSCHSHSDPTAAAFPAHTLALVALHCCT